MIEKYRIVTTSNNKLLNVKYKIQTKFLFWWNTIEKEECCKTSILEFDSYEEAEEHLKKNYFHPGGDVFKPAPNVYHYEKFFDEFDYYDGMCL